MINLSRERLYFWGSAALVLLGLAVASGEQTSVAHAALNVLNNRAVVAQNEPPTATPIPDTPTPQPGIPTATQEVTPTSQAESPTSTPQPEAPTSTPAATATPQEQTPTNTPVTNDEQIPTPTATESPLTVPATIKVVVLDADNVGISGVNVSAERERPSPFTISGQTDQNGSYSLYTEVTGPDQNALLEVLGPNAALTATYAITSQVGFEQIVLLHDGGADLSSSMIITFANPLLTVLASQAAEEPTATPGPTDAPEATATPDAGTPTPQTLKPELSVQGNVSLDSLSIVVDPDGTQITVTDFENEGKITVQPADLHNNAIAAGIDDVASNFDVTIFSAANNDGFNLTLGKDGKTKTSLTVPAGVDGTLSFNPSQLTDTGNGTASLEISVDSNNDGITDQKVPVTGINSQESRIYMPLVAGQ